MYTVEEAVISLPLIPAQDPTPDRPHRIPQKTHTHAHLFLHLTFLLSVSLPCTEMGSGRSFIQPQFTN